MTANGIGRVAFHVGSALGFDGSGPVLASLLLLGGLTSVILVVLSAVAFCRRRSRSYLLVTLALGALSIKAFLGGVWMFRLMPVGQHHFFEHGLDLLTAALLGAAVYYARAGSNDGKPSAEEFRSR